MRVVWAPVGPRHSGHGAVVGPLLRGSAAAAAMADRGCMGGTGVDCGGGRGAASGAAAGGGQGGTDGANAGVADRGGFSPGSGSTSTDSKGNYREISRGFNIRSGRTSKQRRGGAFWCRRGRSRLTSSNAGQ